jgi:hypothetical protein
VAPLPAPPPSGRFVLHIPASLALTLALVWLLTLVVAYMVGTQWGRQGATSATAPVPGAAEAAQAAPVEARKPAERWLVVLRTEPVTADRRKQYRDAVKSWNDYVDRTGPKALRPWFAMREPANGQIELVYGRQGDTWGIDREAGQEAFAMLSAPKPGGGGFGAAKWVKAE